ncbi:MAG: membrane protein insertase YidC [Bacteroidales bacterium]|nr:membrane protein insertase YidC [Bacteroidales bacterium]MBN2749057.1 membrane protein insertase YidC [Bacteroidales bacterium]
MDRNTIIGLVLIFLIIIGFSYFNRPSQEEIEAARRKADSIATVQAEYQRKRADEVAAQNQLNDSLQQAETQNRLGSLASAVTGEQKFITLENDLIRVTLSTLGGRVYSAEIKDYKTYGGEPLILFDGDINTFGLQFWGNNNSIQTNNLYFNALTEASSLTIAEGDTSVSVVMRLEAGEESYIDYVYSVAKGSHLVNFDIKFVGMDKVMNHQKGSIDLIWENMVPQLEKGAKNERDYTTIAYSYPNKEYEELNMRSDSDDEKITTKLKWIAFKQQFFSSILVADDAMLNADLEQHKVEDGEYIQSFKSRIGLPIDKGADETVGFQFYFGPNHYKTLKAYNLEFEAVVPLGGWGIRWINQGVVFVFDILDNRIANYGLIILLLTIFIKVVLFPLTYKSYLSSAKMRVLKPQVDELNAKFPKKDDAMKKQQAVMALYKKVGVNPMGGCIPILIQFPILIAMFRFFPASFELRQKSFLWADDLSSFDSILDLPFNIPYYGAHISLFTILMAAALFITSKMNTDQMGDTSSQLPGMKFMMIYMMPIMMIFWFNNYSSGLSYYYFLSNVFTLGQTLLIRKFVDDKAILSKLHENAKKPVKKSRLQTKLEEIAKQQNMPKRK